MSNAQSLAPKSSKGVYFVNGGGARLTTNDEALLRERGTHERRKRTRFAIEQEVRYRLLNGPQLGESGSGRTLNVSSGGIFITTEAVLTEGTCVEVSMRWPALLHDSCPMKLHLYGCVVRSNDCGAVVTIERYEFRTQGKSFERP